MDRPIVDFVDRKRSRVKADVTERDREILSDIYEFDGQLADFQVKRLRFGDNADMQQTKKRLSILFHKGYLNRLNRAGWTRYGCNVYWLTKRGLEEVLGTRGEELSNKDRPTEPRWAQLDHDIIANDITLTFVDACNKSEGEFTLQEWYPERFFRSNKDKVSFVNLAGSKTERMVFPDRMFIVDRKQLRPDEPFRARLLLELDLSNHPNKRFAEEKVLPGTAYIKDSEAYERRFGSRSGRWLVVTTSQERLEYLLKTVQVAKEFSSMWYFTDLTSVTVDTVLTESIWTRIRDGKREQVAIFGER